MSDYVKLACAILPPQEDNIGVMAVTTSAGAATDTGVSAGAPRYVTFICDVACYITFSNDGLSTNITDPDGTAVAGSGRTWRIPADLPFPVLVGSMQRYFKPRGTASGTLRFYISSP